MILLLLSKYSKHICLFEVALKEGEAEVLTMEEEKILIISRSDGERHQVSDEDHASSFSYKGRGRTSLGIPNIFIGKNMVTPLNFAGGKLKMRRKKNQASSTREKRRVRMILSFSHVMSKKLHTMKCDTSTIDVAII